MRRIGLLIVSAGLLAGCLAGPFASSGEEVPNPLPVGCSIQAAIDAAAPGTVIDLAAGTHFGSIDIDRPLTLRGAEEGTTIIEGTILGAVVRVAGQGIAVRLERLTVRGGRGWNGHGIQTEGSPTVDLDAVTATANAWCGVWATDRSVLTLRGCRLIENGTHGLYTWDFTRVDARDCEISRNETHGILAFHLSELSLVDCDISENLSGVWVWDGVRFHAERCHIADHALCGLVGQNGAYLDLAHCVISSNRENGLWFTDSSRGTLRACTISGNGSDGVFLERDGIVEFFDCLIEANTGAGIRAITPTCTGVFVSGAPYKGWVEGSGNVVPGPNEARGNLLSLCPGYPGSLWPEGFLAASSTPP